MTDNIIWTNGTHKAVVEDIILNDVYIRIDRMFIKMTMTNFLKKFHRYAI